MDLSFLNKVDGDITIAIQKIIKGELVFDNIKTLSYEDYTTIRNIFKPVEQEIKKVDKVAKFEQVVNRDDKIILSDLLFDDAFERI